MAVSFNTPTMTLSWLLCQISTMLGDNMIVVYHGSILLYLCQTVTCCIDLSGLLTAKVFGSMCAANSSGSTSTLMTQPNMAGFSVITSAYSEGLVYRASSDAVRVVFRAFVGSCYSYNRV